jgi:CheY-specific phosphatase CheX
MLGQPRETAISLAKTFEGFEIPFESADMGDAVGELTNVLAGSVTAHMENAGFKVQMSLPTAARGTDVELLLGGGLPSTFMPFTTPNGNCWIRLVMAKPR